LSYDVVNTHSKGFHNVGEFGDKFRKTREEKELSLDDVSNVTKIGARMLKAIEEEHFDQLPGGVFNKGFIRAYAKHLGLDAEGAVNDYLACLRQVQVDSPNGWDGVERRHPQAPGATKAKLVPLKPEVKVEAPLEVEELPDLHLPRTEHIRAAKKEYLWRPSSGIPWLQIAVVICLLTFAFFLWTRHSRSTRAAGAQSSSSAASVPSATVAAPPAQSTPAPQSPAPPAATATPPPHLSTKSARPSLETPPAANHAAAPVPAAGISPDPNDVEVEKTGDVTIRSVGAGVAKPAQKPAATLKLIVRASENSWISVTSDGQLVTRETLIAPAATSFHAERELVIRVGNAAGVSFLFNGEELPPQGAEAEVKTFIFDAQGMRSAAGPQVAAQP
jgi:cytoskeleton protein RodZ